MLRSAATRFSIAFAAGALSALLAFAFERVTGMGTADPRLGGVAYALAGGLVGGWASLAMGWLWGAGAATRAGLLVMAAFLLLQLLYFVNVRLLPGDPYYSTRSLLLNVGILLLVSLPPLWVLRSQWVKGARQRLGQGTAVLGAALMLGLGVAAGEVLGKPAKATAREGGQGPNLLLVVLDSVRRDHLGVYGYARPTSPALDRLAREARVFEGAASASSWTVPSVQRLLRSGDGGSGKGLVARLEEQGYLAACFTDNPHLGPGSSITRQFDRVERSVGTWRVALRGTLLGEFVERVDGGSDRRLVSRALAWARQSRGPFLLYVHLMESHTPYDESPIDGRRRRGRRIQFPLPGMPMTAEEAEDVIARYDGGIRAADAEAGRLLEAARGWGRPFVAIVTADHGESLGEHGRWFHGGSLAPELLAVPLVVLGEGVSPGRVGALVDYSSIPKTLLAAAGLPCRRCPGSDLRTSTGDGFAEGVLPPNLTYRMRDGYKLIVDRASGRSQLFDFQADPGETRDLTPSRPELARALASAPLPGAEQRAPDPEELSRLRALGYLGY